MGLGRRKGERQVLSSYGKSLHVAKSFFDQRIPDAGDNADGTDSFGQNPVDDSPDGLLVTAEKADQSPCRDSAKRGKGPITS